MIAEAGTCRVTHLVVGDKHELGWKVQAGYTTFVIPDRIVLNIFVGQLAHSVSFKCDNQLSLRKPLAHKD